MLIGSSSELAQEFLTYIDKDKFRYFLITSSNSKFYKETNVLKINDYINDVDLIAEFMKTSNPIIIFFNGFITENRPIKYPNVQVIKTDYGKFVPYVLTIEINNSVKKC